MVRHRSGQEHKRISKALSAPRSTVALINRKEEMFETNKTPSASCPTKLWNQTRRALVRKVTENPVVTLTEFQTSSAEMGGPAEGQPS